MTMKQIALCGLILGFLSAIQTVSAQEEDRSERFFRMLDRNQDDELDETEIANFGPLNNYLQQQGFDLSQPLTRQEFASEFAAFREAGGGFGGGRGPGGGGFGGGPGGGGFGGGGPGAGGPGGRGRGGPEMQGDSRRGGEDRRTPAKEKPGARIQKFVRPTLPESYVRFDVDGDGQIALFEWDRKQLAAFADLDLNGDGFLTPQELVAAAKTAPTGTPRAVADAGRPNGDPREAGSRREGFSREGGGGREGGARGAGSTRIRFGPGGPSASPAAGPGGFPASAGPASGGSSSSETTAEVDPVVRRANSAFKLLDTDKDNVISPAEFEKSRSIAKDLRDAGIDLTQSMDSAKFQVEFRKAVEFKAKKAEGN